MSLAATQPELHAQMPDLARRLGVIMAGLGALVAARFLRIPGLVAIIVPLHTRLIRTGRRLARLAALFAAGRLPPPPAPRQGGGGPTRPPAFCTRTPWLLATLRHEGAYFRLQLECLLAEPGMAALLAASPAAGRLLNPLCRMLALPPARPPGPRRRRAAAAPAPAQSAAPDRAGNPTPGRGIALAPLAPPSRDAAPPPARLPPPLCPRARWPWFGPGTANPI